MVRRTAQREAIRRVLQRTERPLSPPEILALAQAEVPQLGLTTVYRALNALVERGWLSAVQLPGEATRYEVAHKPPHDFFRCRSCGRVYDVARHEVHAAKLPPDFVVEDRVLMLVGLCGACAALARRRSGTAVPPTEQEAEEDISA